MANAVIFIPDHEHLAEYGVACHRYLEARGYQFAGLVTTCWEDATALLFAQRGGVLVVARAEHLPPDREPRVEVALPDDPRPTNASARAAYRQRRPHRV